jgi:hypothetical protein
MGKDNGMNWMDWVAIGIVVIVGLLVMALAIDDASSSDEPVGMLIMMLLLQAVCGFIIWRIVA